LILVTGFGPFGAVVDNPAARVARGVDGRRTGGETVVGVVIPTSFARGPAATIAAARTLRARFVVGIGVATTRSGVEVERRAVAWGDGRTPDIDGAILDRLDGPEVVPATLDPERLAAALGADLSDDAGRYVCNAWLHRVATGLDVPVGFVHIPSTGLDPERLLAALRWIR